MAQPRLSWPAAIAPDLHRRAVMNGATDGSKHSSSGFWIGHDNIYRVTEDCGEPIGKEEWEVRNHLTLRPKDFRKLATI